MRKEPAAGREDGHAVNQRHQIKLRISYRSFHANPHFPFLSSLIFRCFQSGFTLTHHRKKRGLIVSPISYWSHVLSNQQQRSISLEADKEGCNWNWPIGLLLGWSSDVVIMEQSRDLPAFCCSSSGSQHALHKKQIIFSPICLIFLFTDLKLLNSYGIWWKCSCHEQSNTLLVFKI